MVCGDCTTGAETDCAMPDVGHSSPICPLHYASPLKSEHSERQIALGCARQPRGASVAILHAADGGPYRLLAAKLRRLPQKQHGLA